MYILVGTVYISHLSQEKRGEDMYILVGTVYISHLSQEKRGEDMYILVGTVYISHLSQEKRGEYISCRYCLHFVGRYDHLLLSTFHTYHKRREEKICTFL